MFFVYMMITEINLICDNATSLSKRKIISRGVNVHTNFQFDMPFDLTFFSRRSQNLKMKK